MVVEVFVLVLPHYTKLHVYFYIPLVPSFVRMDSLAYLPPCGHPYFAEGSRYLKNSDEADLDDGSFLGHSSIYPSLHPSTHSSFLPSSTQLFIYLYIYSPIHLTIDLSTQPSIHSTIHLSIHLSI